MKWRNVTLFPTLDHEAVCTGYLDNKKPLYFSILWFIVRRNLTFLLNYSIFSSGKRTLSALPVFQRCGGVCGWAGVCDLVVSWIVQNQKAELASLKSHSRSSSWKKSDCKHFSSLWVVLQDLPKPRLPVFKWDRLEESSWVTAALGFKWGDQEQVGIAQGACLYRQGCYLKSK